MRKYAASSLKVRRYKKKFKFVSVASRGSATRLPAPSLRQTQSCFIENLPSYPTDIDLYIAAITLRLPLIGNHRLPRPPQLPRKGPALVKNELRQQQDTSARDSPSRHLATAKDYERKRLYLQLLR